jgi:hypothetical protein
LNQTRLLAIEDGFLLPELTGLSLLSPHGSGFVSGNSLGTSSDNRVNGRPRPRDITLEQEEGPDVQLVNMRQWLHGQGFLNTSSNDLPIQSRKEKHTNNRLQLSNDVETQVESDQAIFYK